MYSLSGLCLSMKGDFRMIKETTKILTKEITDILQVFGMPAHIRGFYYVRDAIILVYQDSTRLNHIIKDVYALVAKRHHTSSQSVERTIRVAIEITWLRGDMDEIMCIFHNTVDGRKARPTNKEFIALIVDYLNIKHM